MINAYQGSIAHVICNEKLLAGFTIRTGAGQGYLLSPLLFLSDRHSEDHKTMRRTTGSTWTLQMMKGNSCRQGLGINAEKTKMMRVKARSSDPTTVNGAVIKEFKIQDFTNLGKITPTRMAELTMTWNCALERHTG